MVDAIMQFPLDVADDISHEHSYCSQKSRNNQFLSLFYHCFVPDVGVLLTGSDEIEERENEGLQY